MQSDDIYKSLTEIFQDVFLRDDLVVTPELSAKDVDGWNSFKMIEIIMATEERLNVELSIQEVDGLKCVGDLANVLLSKMK